MDLKTVQKQKEKILENEEYIKSLEECTTENEKTIDRINGENLEPLFLVIEDYAEENYIYPIGDTFGWHYTISYNGNNYNIGFTRGQGTFFYCTRTEDESMLDFKDILEGKKSVKTDLIKLKLTKLEIIVNDYLSFSQKER